MFQDCLRIWLERARVRVFITGATGFVGGHVARRYAAEGASLRLLTRQTSRLDLLAGIDAETVTGDLREPEKLRSALVGCDALVHVAADYRLWVRDPERCMRPMSTGTRELLTLAREAGSGVWSTPRAWRRWGSSKMGRSWMRTSPVSLRNDRPLQTVEISWRSRRRSRRRRLASM